MLTLKSRFCSFTFLVCALIGGCSGGGADSNPPPATGNPPPVTGTPPPGTGTPPPTTGTPPPPTPTPTPTPPGTIPAERAVLNVVASQTWRSCSPEYFGGCSFEGLREVRFGTDGKWRSKIYLNSFPGWECSSTNFGGDPAQGEVKRCEVSNVMLTGTIPAPRVCHSGGMCPEIDLTAIPMGLEGSGELRVRATTEIAPDSSDKTGAFRTVCGFSHMAFDDPIVYPGQPGVSHLHAFFGNVGANAYSTAQSLANSGNSTCLGGIANRSAYWVPAMINTATKKPLVPAESIWYYKTGYGGVAAASVQPMPAGLRMIAGDMMAEGTQSMAYWSCHESGTMRGASIPNCPAGEHVAMTIQFPQCWDGANLDSTNHKSHMAYPTGQGCPSSHPVPLPEITLNVHYLVRTANEALNWRLSSDRMTLPAGISSHADWFDGWNPQIRDAWVVNCNQKAKDCHAHLLGDGRTLY